jgi:2-polyprenyl-3-methyl-5-hydroxy-6-metoxy-1,4-benzoquinol methylase
MKKNPPIHEIVEKKLGIPPDYQYKAIRSSNFLQSNWHANKFTALQYCLDLNKTTCVLDLGVGSGNFELIFAHNVKKITAVDYHKEALDFLRSKLQEKQIRNVRLIHSDIRKLHKIQKIGTYDLVILIDVIEHIQLKEASKVIKFLKKILSPEGSVCVVTPNYHSLWLVIEEILDTFTIVPHFAGHQHLAQYHAENLKDMFEKNGFTTKKITSFNLFSYISPLRTLSTTLSKLELSSNTTFGNLLMGVFTLTSR